MGWIKKEGLKAQTLFVRSNFQSLQLMIYTDYFLFLSFTVCNATTIRSIIVLLPGYALSLAIAGAVKINVSPDQENLYPLGSLSCPIPVPSGLSINPLL